MERGIITSYILISLRDKWETSQGNNFLPACGSVEMHVYSPAPEYVVLNGKWLKYFAGKSCRSAELLLWGCEIWADVTGQPTNVHFFFFSSSPWYYVISDVYLIVKVLCINAVYHVYSLWWNVKKKKWYSLQNRLGNLRIILPNVWYFICYPIFTLIHVHWLHKAYLFFLAVFCL